MLFPLPINNNTTASTTTSLSSPPCSIITPPTLTIPRASHSFSYCSSSTTRRNSCNIVYNGKPTCSTNIVNAAAASASVSLLINLDLLDEDEQTLTTTTGGGIRTSVWQRRLILLRHAKSRWPNPSIRDHDRPLDEVGEADAIKVSHRLHKLGWVPDLILSSDARRTRETLKFMQESVREFSEVEVHFIPSFYSVAAMDGQTTEHIRDAICKFSHDGILTVMCMGHNRGWEEAASVLSGTSIELKTCNAALLEGTGKSWEEAFSVAGAGGWKLRGIVTPSG